MKRSILFCFFAAFGGWVFGYDIGYISGCLIMSQFAQQMGGYDKGDGTYALTSEQQSIITSLLSAGTFFGALLQTLTSDRLGRRGSIMFWGTIFTIGIIIQVSSFSIGQLAAGRCVAGFGVGALSAIVPLYIGEAAPKKWRGSLLVLYQVQIASGLFLAYIIDLGTHHINSNASWRIPVGLQLIWGAFLIFGAMALPESPRLLLGKHREKDAIIAAAKLNDCKPDDPIVAEVIAELSEAIKEENEGGKAGWLGCFSSRSKMYHRTLNGMFVQFFQQLCGQNFYYYYGPVFFQAARTSLDSYEIQAVLGGVSLAMVVPAMWTIEHVGRRKSLLIGAALQAICAIIAGLVGHFMTSNVLMSGQSIETQQMGGKLLIAFAIIQVAFYSMFWGPTPWVILGETFPLRVRPKSIALGSATNWFWNFMLSYFSPLIVADIGPLIMLIFFGCLIAAFIYVFFLVPETKGLSLEEVDMLYRSDCPPWRSSSWVPPVRQRQGQDKLEGQGRQARFSQDTVVGNLQEKNKNTAGGAGVEQVEHTTSVESTSSAA